MNFINGVYVMQSKQLIKIVKQDGWVKVATKGSHCQFKHPTKEGKVTIPHPKKDLPLGTIRSIYRQAGLNA